MWGISGEGASRLGVYRGTLRSRLIKLADVRILELRTPFSASHFNLQLINIFTN